MRAIENNTLRVKKNMQLPHLVANVVEVIRPQQEEAEDGATADSNAELKADAVVIKTSTRKVSCFIST